MLPAADLLAYRWLDFSKMEKLFCSLQTKGIENNQYVSFSVTYWLKTGAFFLQPPLFNWKWVEPAGGVIFRIPDFDKGFVVWAVEGKTRYPTSVIGKS